MLNNTTHTLEAEAAGVLITRKENPIQVAMGFTECADRSVTGAHT